MRRTFYLTDVNSMEKVIADINKNSIAAKQGVPYTFLELAEMLENHDRKNTMMNFGPFRISISPYFWFSWEWFIVG